MPIPTINENSALFATITFTDENGDSIVPNTIDWRVEDLTADRHNPIEIIAWTPVGVPAASVDVQIPSSSNATTDTDKNVSLRVIRVRMNDGLATEAHQQKYYRIKNLTGAP